MKRVMMLGNRNDDLQRAAPLMSDPALELQWIGLDAPTTGGALNQRHDLLCLSVDDEASLAWIADHRSRGANTPILALTARTDWQWRVKVLDCGADSCMVMPTDPDEVQARVRALFRRGVGSPVEVIACGPISYDAIGHVVEVHGRMVELSAREMLLLEYMLRRPGRLVAKGQLVQALCEADDGISRNAIEVYIHRLRRKIINDEFHIATIRGEGYRLERIPVAARHVRAPRPAEARVPT